MSQSETASVRTCWLTSQAALKQLLHDAIRSCLQQCMNLQAGSLIRFLFVFGWFAVIKLSHGQC